MFFLFVIILKKYLITSVRTCKCKDFKILKSDQESDPPTPRIGSDREVTKGSHS